MFFLEEHSEIVRR